jgi:hypothetical protein
LTSAVAVSAVRSWCCRAWSHPPSCSRASCEPRRWPQPSSPWGCQGGGGGGEGGLGVRVGVLLREDEGAIQEGVALLLPCPNADQREEGTGSTGRGWRRGRGPVLIAGVGEHVKEEAVEALQEIPQLGEDLPRNDSVPPLPNSAARLRIGHRGWNVRYQSQDRRWMAPPCQAPALSGPPPAGAPPRSTRAPTRAKRWGWARGDGSLAAPGLERARPP